MRLNPQLPLSIRITAWLFLLDGLGSLIGMILSLFQKPFNVSFGFLFIYAALGLLRLSNGWRWFCLVCLAIQIAAIPILMYLFVKDGIRPTTLTLLHYWRYQFQGQTVIVLMIFILVVALFQLHTLTKRPTKALFKFRPVDA